MKKPGISRRRTQQGGHVYILSNEDRTMFYVGATSSLNYRVKQHLLKVYPDSFTAKYDCTRLVYQKQYSHMEEARAEEKRIKALDRSEKTALAGSANPDWQDLFPVTDIF